MQGYLQYYKGKIRGYKKYYGIIEEGCTNLSLFKKEAYEQHYKTINLSQTDDLEVSGRSSNLTSEISTNADYVRTKDEKLFIIKVDGKKTYFKCDATERDKWVNVISQIMKVETDQIMTSSLSSSMNAPGLMIDKKYSNHEDFEQEETKIQKDWMILSQYGDEPALSQKEDLLEIHSEFMNGLMSKLEEVNTNDTIDEDKKQKYEQINTLSLQVQELLESMNQNPNGTKNESSFMSMTLEESPEIEVQTPLAIDNDIYRMELPVLRDSGIKPQMLWQVVKDLIGKDLSKFSLPVFINEPVTTLQKAAEMICFCQTNFEAACNEENSLMRMVYLANYNASTFFLVQGRTAKPFNPMLGETYELVTKHYRFFAEQVSHHPPVAAINCQGNGWELNKMVKNQIKFNGRNVQAEDIYPTKVELYPKTLKGQKETYVLATPKLTVGNLLIGERYIEPTGQVIVKNTVNGDTCILDFKARSWVGGVLGQIQGKITSGDPKNKNVIKIQGSYTSKIEAFYENKPDKKWVIFEAPVLPYNRSQMYNMNYFTLQLNYLSENLRAKIPPTDSRLRPDIRAWESADLNLASNEKARLEKNQRERRKNLDAQTDIYNEQEFYSPRFFEKIRNSQGKYEYVTKGNKYWEDREAQNWVDVPQIFEDNCKSFY